MLQGKRLQRMRIRRGLTQAALGKKIGQDQQYISKLERGVLPGITVETLVRLCESLACSADFLLGLIDDEEIDEAA